MVYLLTANPAILTGMADIETLHTNYQLSKSDEAARSRTQVDLCDPCAKAFIDREEATSLSYNHATDPQQRSCTICRGPAKRWTVETLHG